MPLEIAFVDLKHLNGTKRWSSILCCRVQSQLIGMLYAKSLRLHSASRSRYGTGQIVNLQSNDATKLYWLPVFMHVLWSAPLQVCDLVLNNYNHSQQFKLPGELYRRRRFSSPNARLRSKCRKGAGVPFGCYERVTDCFVTALQILVVCALLVRVMGLWPAVAGLAVTLLLIPTSSFIGRRLSKARKAVVAQTDARVKLTTEVRRPCPVYQ